MMERRRLHEQLLEGIKNFLTEVKPTILNGVQSYIIEHPEEDRIMVYNLEISEVREFPVYECAGGETSPTQGCGKLFSDSALANQHSFRRKYPEDAQELLQVLEKKESLEKRPIGKDRIIEETKQGRQKASHWLNFLEHREVIEQTQRGYTFHEENMKPLVCPFCGGTEFRKIESLEEWEKRYSN